MSARSLAEVAAEIDFERQGAIRRAFKAAIINPLANYAPVWLLRRLLRFGRSELAEANWADPGGWRSMVISYHGRPTQIADKLLVGGGTMSMALRNRRRLGSRIISELIDSNGDEQTYILCLGAGPGQIIIDAMSQAKTAAFATLVDISDEPFAFGRQLAANAGLADHVRFVHSDARHIKDFLDHSPQLVKMLGICEYLDDEHIVSIAAAAAQVMSPGAAIVFNSLSKAHGNDRFFRRVFGLNMIHRSPEALERLIGRAGFGGFESVAEPLGVYHVIVGRRQAGRSAA
jgi:hypothetical protein